jgi:predicted peptidase
MSLFSTLMLLGMFGMLEPQGTVDIEPGKQLPQSVTVQAHDGLAARDVTIHYLLFTPKEYKSDGEPWPLLLFLHGYGESGRNELERVKIHGPPKLVEKRADFPFIVVAPQCPPVKYDMKEIVKAWKADELIQLVDHVAKNLNIDPTRIYVTGLSMGGFGTWRLVAAHPERFAAALPICGGGEPDTMAKSLTGVPIWAFHGARDSVVPLSASEKMVDAVRQAGGQVEFTVYPNVEHDSWTQTYDNEKVYEWLLSHRRPVQ